jgi:polyisoprenoid-binding protein YceI
MLATFCVAGVAKADIQRTLEGRWVAKNQSLTLDLSRCDDGWCGVAVTNAGSCGRTVLRAAKDTGKDDGQLTGRLDLDAQALPYTIAIHLVRRKPNDPETLVIRGHTRSNASTEFQPWRRIYPYMVEFARAGDATCRHGPKVS